MKNLLISEQYNTDHINFAIKNLLGKPKLMSFYRYYISTAKPLHGI